MNIVHRIVPYKNPVILLVDLVKYWVAVPVRELEIENSNRVPTHEHIVHVKIVVSESWVAIAYAFEIKERAIHELGSRDEEPLERSFGYVLVEHVKSVRAEFSTVRLWDYDRECSMERFLCRVLVLTAQFEHDSLFAARVGTPLPHLTCFENRETRTQYSFVLVPHKHVRITQVHPFEFFHLRLAAKKIQGMAVRVLVTGAAGFIGHYVVKKILDETDWDVIGLERLSFSGSLERLHEAGVQGGKRYSSIHHDLRSPIGEILQKQIGPVDYIVHIGANSHVDRSIEDPLSFVMDNVVGTCTILDFARTQKDHLKCFLYFSTDEVFGPAPQGVKYDEYDRYNSTNPYSATKAGGEELAVAFRNTYGLPVVVTHTMNVFGQRQHPEKFIPKCIRKVLRGETIEIHSDETRTVPGSRHYIHAEDVADGVLFILKKELWDKGVPLDKRVRLDKDASLDADTCSGNGISCSSACTCPKFNLVGPEEVNNLELAQLIADIIGKPLKYELVDFHSSRPGHDLRYAISGDRLAKVGWTPKESLRQRLSEVVTWTLENPKWT